MAHVCTQPFWFTGSCQLKGANGTHNLAHSREPTTLRIQGNSQICTLMGGQRSAHSRHQCVHSREPTTLRSQRNPQMCTLMRSHRACASRGDHRVANAREPMGPTTSRNHGNPHTCTVIGGHRCALSRDPTELPTELPTEGSLGTHKVVHSGEPTWLAHSGEPTELPPHGNQWNPPLRAFTGDDHVAHSREPTHLRIQGNPRHRALKGTHRAFDRAPSGVRPGS